MACPRSLPRDLQNSKVRKTKDKMKWKDPIDENKATTVRTSAAAARFPNPPKCPLLRRLRRLATLSPGYKVNFFTCPK